MFSFCKCKCIYGSNGLWIGAISISDGIFSIVCVDLVARLKRRMMKWIGGSPSHSWWCLSSRKECYPESSPIHCNPHCNTLCVSLQCTIIPFHCTTVYCINVMCDYELHYIAISHWTLQIRFKFWPNKATQYESSWFPSIHIHTSYLSWTPRTMSTQKFSVMWRNFR